MDQFLLGKPLVKSGFFKSFPKIRSDGEFGFDLKNPGKVRFYGFNNSDLDFPPKKRTLCFKKSSLWAIN